MLIKYLLNNYVNLRNPYKAILSYWNFKNTKSHTKTISGDSLRSQKFQQFARTGAQRYSQLSSNVRVTLLLMFRWLEVIKDWLQYSTDLYCIYYEVRSSSRPVLTLLCPGAGQG